MTDTGLTAALNEIRERSDRPLPHVTSLPISHDGVRCLMASAADVPRLLAAVDAVLKVHHPEPATLWRACPEHQMTRTLKDKNRWEKMRACPDCEQVAVPSCGECLDADWPCPTVTELTRALTGETDE
jgi:hypothetical protein